MAVHRTNEEFINAIQGSGGIKTVIAQTLKVSRETVTKRLKKSKTLQAAYFQETERVIDLAEHTIIKAINQNDIQTAKWYLTLKARERGYGESDVKEADIDDKIEIVITTKEDNTDEDTIN